MKISIRIGDIEVSIERPEFCESQNSDYQTKSTNEVIRMLQEAVKEIIKLRT